LTFLKFTGIYYRQ